MPFRLETVACRSVLALALAAPAAAFAQATPAPQGTPTQQAAPGQPGTAPQPGAGAQPGAAGQQAGKPAGNPVLARVGDQEIRLSDLRSAAATLPPNLRSMPEQVLYPMLLDRMIDQDALVAEARRTGLDKDPEVKRQVQMAEDSALQRALLMKEVQPQVTDQAVRARYEKDTANKPGAEEVHAKHILVDSEAQAKDIIAQLQKGADFDALAKQYSKDKGAGGGDDLGFFKKEDMVPEFAAAAFALQPGQTTQTPVHTQFGWHVIEVTERRQDKPPSFADAKNELRQRMAQEAAEKVVAQALTGVKVERFNPDGTPMSAAEATPAPAAK
ncbi:MAG: peptidylprolyl isomerase [Acetobacteraceae bacterium]|nr:peptidylprolyl isomerase [Acetobacteraceae bacterium]